MKETKGYIHSVETFGAVDGPGIRFVVFFQGCKLRCRFCHNPDTWRIDSPNARVVTAEELLSEILQYKNYIKNGGVTFSGGEPLLQPAFLNELITLCHQNGLHTAVDTAGGDLSFCKEPVEAADLILLDIKAADPEDCKKVTGFDNKLALDVLDFRENLAKDVWIRHVLVPGLTLDEQKLIKLAELLKRYRCIKKIELLPFHKMGEYKWKTLGLNYTLNETSEPKADEVKTAYEILKRFLPESLF